MTTPPPEASAPVIAPTAEETRALSNSASDSEIRELAQTLLTTTQLGFDPTTILKGIITAVEPDTSPPTVSIQISGDTTTTVAEVRILNSYSPQVGHTVLVAKQGADIVILGNISNTAASGTDSGAGDWTKATLAAGSHDGNSNGDVAYRKVLDHGAWKMQWRGGWSVSGTTVISALDTEFRPSHRVSMLAARTSTGAISVYVVFETDGSVVLAATTTGTNSSNASGDVGTASMSTGSGGGFSVGDHSHAIPFDGDADGGGADHNHFGSALSSGAFSLGSHSHGASHDHSFFGGSHSHPVTAPTWVSFNGLEYFL